jgi:hypothetical protein
MLIEMIANETGASHDYLKHVVATASRRYRTYEIEKRSGGTREINHPTPLLKFLQRWIVRNVLLDLPVHSSVTSYKPGDNVLKNALAHVDQGYLLKMDFRDFFPSITSIDIRNVLRKNRQVQIIGQFSEADEAALLSIVCRNGSLTIGSPSSPPISNAVLFAFDQKIFAACLSAGIVYTRYADDMSFSSSEPNALFRIPSMVEDVLAVEASPRLQINNKKTILSSRKHRRMVTGVILTSDKKISIGRKKKRWLRSACFKFINGDLTANEASRLRGYLSFVHSVEPQVIVGLKKKFGEASINRILRQSLLPLKYQDRAGIDDKMLD